MWWTAFAIFVLTAATDSLDGYIARRDGTIDWLTAEPPPDDQDFGYEAFMASIDVLVMGRHTFEQVLTFPDWPYGDRHVVVLTSRPWDVPDHLRDTVVRMSGTPGEVVERLANEGLRHVYLDGGITIQRFLAAGLVDDLTVTRLPILIGGGLPLFGALPGDVRLVHEVTRAFSNGYVQSRYRVDRPH